MKRNLSLLGALVFILLFLAPSSGAVGVRGGIRGGITDDPDTGFIGGHLAIDILRSHLRIEPSLELGFGDHGLDDYFTLRFNGNFKYMVLLNRQMRFKVYPLIGLAIYYHNWDNANGDHDETDVGFNLGGGLELFGVLFELAVTLPDDMPDLTLTFGFTF